MSVKTKAELRSYYKELRNGLSPDVKSQLDGMIAENLFSLDVYKSCDVLLAFVSMDIEVSTERVINRAFADGKTVAVPRCDTSSNTMAFYIIHSFDDLVSGYFGILEPKSSCVKLNDCYNAVCLVPGIVYDKKGYRVGFGGGYYDRFLRGFNGVSVGVCYADCVLQTLPKDDFDCRVDILITEK